jgi:hypothetical protein
MDGLRSDDQFVPVQLIQRSIDASRNACQCGYRLLDIAPRLFDERLEFALDESLFDEERPNGRKKIELQVELATDTFADGANSDQQHHVWRETKRKVPKLCRQLGDDQTPANHAQQSLG